MRGPPLQRCHVRICRAQMVLRQRCASDDAKLRFRCAALRRRRSGDRGLAVVVGHVIVTVAEEVARRRGKFEQEYKKTTR